MGRQKRPYQSKNTSLNLNHIYLPTIGPDVLYSKKEDILYLSFKAELKLSKTSHSLDHLKQRYFVVKILSVVFKRITSANNGKFYCFNCLHSFKTKNKLKPHKKIKYLKIKIFAVMEYLLKKMKSDKAQAFLPQAFI